MRRSTINLLTLFVASQLWSFSQAKQQEESPDNPLLAIVIMVKNEESSIRETLQPYVDGGIKHYLVYDTGSTDDTMPRAKALFQQHDIKHGFVISEPFIDFATSRNKALTHAESLFPQATFFLMPDAEWYMHNVAGLLEFCKNQSQATNCDGWGEGYACPGYMIKIGSPGWWFYTGRLLRVRSHSRFIGAVHETASPVSHQKVFQDVYFEYAPNKDGNKSTAKRWLRDREILLKVLQKDLTDSRAAFYLAQTEQCLRNWPDAYRYYKLRVSLNPVSGFPEENYRAVYNLADVTNELSKIDSSFTWQEALGYYLEAFNMRPIRAEPLVRIAQHYQEVGEQTLSCFFARQAAEIPLPEDEVLDVLQSAYEDTVWELLEKCPVKLSEKLEVEEKEEEDDGDEQAEFDEEFDEEFEMFAISTDNELPSSDVLT